MYTLSTVSLGIMV